MLDHPAGAEDRHQLYQNLLTICSRMVLSKYHKQFCFPLRQLWECINNGHHRNQKQTHYVYVSVQTHLYIMHSLAYTCSLTGICFPSKLDRIPSYILTHARVRAHTHTKTHTPHTHIYTHTTYTHTNQLDLACKRVHRVRIYLEILHNGNRFDEAALRIGYDPYLSMENHLII